MECLHDPANVEQTSNKCIQNTRVNAGRLLDRVNPLSRLSSYWSADWRDSTNSHQKGFPYL